MTVTQVLSAEDEAAIAKHYEMGRTIETLSRTYNLTQVRIRRILKKHGVQMRSIVSSSAHRERVRPNKWNYKPEAA